jgi:hypothetical protein
LQPYYQTVASAYYGPRFDYDPSTLAARGLLIEEQRTNSIRNNTMQGAVVGTPGTVPTNWSYGQLSTLTTEIVSTGIETGINYVDVRISGTATTTALVYFEANSTVAGTNAQTWATSLFVKRVGGTETNISVVTTTLRMSDAGGTNLGFVPGSTYVLPTSTANLSACRFSSSHTTNNVSTAFVMPALAFNAAGAIDITLRIGLPQLELGAFATSVIPTTTTALTRAADVASMTGANFSSWYNPVEGTLLTTTLAFNQTFAPNRFISTIDDGTSSNIIATYIPSDLNATTFVVTAGYTEYQAIITAVSNTLPNKLAITYKANNFTSAGNGVSGISDTSGNVPVVNKITFGNRTDGLRPLNGWVRAFSYYPKQLSAGQLQALTK